VHDPLVKQNHRREQSANATAGRNKGYEHWNSHDEDEKRRVGSCERAPQNEDYQILGSGRKPHHTETSEHLKRLVSPSPEVQPVSSVSTASNQA
jgi:hypothetical protein